MKGRRKPDPECFAIAEQTLGLLGKDLLLVDDRIANVEAASNAGWDAIQFKSASQLQSALRARHIL